MEAYDAVGDDVVGVSAAIMQIGRPGKASCSFVAVLRPSTPAPTTIMGDFAVFEPMDDMGESRSSKIFLFYWTSFDLSMAKEPLPFINP